MDGKSDFKLTTKLALKWTYRDKPRTDKWEQAFRERKAKEAIRKN